ncbi:hypothetical protein JCGZ_10946 [Jatropha curcas]|uniref:MADS-box domain-containing protein n=1 Tax=Jatropha curcas TaxID=180498 RepID=A0A067KTD6_JATCU|nr:agamous-like MADS-box protein AGL80 [Jatropha curcas]KDP35104.1 hypothetical protein JCGZ_10946 [Jatropha curcas]
MGRTNIKYELIPDESDRKASFKKRRVGFLKKLKELSTLCGVVACAIIFSDYNSSPDVWPSPSEATLVLEKFKNLPPNKKGKYMMDQETFLKKSIAKLKHKLEKETKKNQRMELELTLKKCIADGNVHHLDSLENANDLSDLLQEKIERLSIGIERAKSKTEDK